MGVSRKGDGRRRGVETVDGDVVFRERERLPDVLLRPTRDRIR